MRILHIYRKMGQGGAEKIIYQLCKAQKQDKNNVYVISSGGSYVENLVDLGIVHVSIPDMENKSLKNIFNIIKTIKRVVKNEKIDIIHTHHRMAAFYSNFIRRKIKKIYTSHNVFFDKRILTRLSISNSTIVACGEGVKRNLVEFYGIPSQKVFVINNAIETKLTKCKNQILTKLRLNDRFIVASIGRLSEQKGFDVFIKAISRCIKHKKKICGVIIGDGELRTQLEDMVKTLSIENDVFFLGYQRDVLDIIKQVDLVVLSSRWEGLPLIPMEVFSQGKTIIATNIEGTNEVVQNGYNGLLFEKDNAEELEKLIINLYVDDTLRIKLQRQAFESFSKNYSYEKFIQEYKNLYLDEFIG